MDAWPLIPVRSADAPSLAHLPRNQEANIADTRTRRDRESFRGTQPNGEFLVIVSPRHTFGVPCPVRYLRGMSGYTSNATTTSKHDRPPFHFAGRARGVRNGFFHYAHLTCSA